MSQARKQATSLLVEAEGLKQQLAARDASLAQAAQRLQAVDAKADAAAVGNGLKVRETCTPRQQPSAEAGSRPSNALQVDCVTAQALSPAATPSSQHLSPSTPGAGSGVDAIPAWAGSPASHARVVSAQVAELKAEAAALSDEVALLRRAQADQRDALRREFEDRHRIAVREHELEMGTKIKVFYSCGIGSWQMASVIAKAEDAPGSHEALSSSAQTHSRPPEA